MASKKSSVLRYIFSLTLLIPCIQIAKSFVIFPDSTQSTHAFSKSLANFPNSGVLSRLALCSRPRVQAKIDAIGFVDVGNPFWCCL